MTLPIENLENTYQKDGTSRREFFEKFGKIALYTPPAMYLLMSPQKEAVACSRSVSDCQKDQTDGSQGPGSGSGQNAFGNDQGSDLFGNGRETNSDIFGNDRRSSSSDLFGNRLERR